MLEVGTTVSADADATRVASDNPAVSLAWMITGRIVGGLRVRPERNCLDRDAALRMRTEKVAWFSADEGRRGRIAPGMLADPIVPDRDYFTLPSSEIADLTGDPTMVGGRAPYAKGDFAALEETPPAMADWSPVRGFGGYAGWKADGEGAALARAAASAADRAGDALRRLYPGPDRQADRFRRRHRPDGAFRPAPAPAFAAGVIGFEPAASAMVIAGVLRRPAAIALGAFTLVALRAGGRGGGIGDDMQSQASAAFRSAAPPPTWRSIMRCARGRWRSAERAPAGPMKAAAPSPPRTAA